MTFREFLKIFEEDGIFINPGPPGPGQTHPPRNIDIYLHQYGSGGVAPATGGIFTGSGPGLGYQQPRRMKKMKKS